MTPNTRDTVLHHAVTCKRRHAVLHQNLIACTECKFFLSLYSPRVSALCLPFSHRQQNKTSELTQMFEEKNRKEREARNRYERQGRKLNRVTRELEEAQKLLQDKLLLLNKAKRNESAYLLELERLRGEVDGAQQRVNELLKDLEAAKTENKKLEEQWKSALIWQNVRNPECLLLYPPGSGMVQRRRGISRNPDINGAHAMLLYRVKCCKR